MNIWTILGIGQTDDKGAIKQAYRERLKSVNPEEDADGFMELRNAYEEAIASCDRQEALPEDMDDEASEGLQPPRTELTDKLEQLYNDYPNRIRVDAWRELFREDAFVSLDTEAEALEELLVFLMDHYRMPDAVFREIVDRFDIALRKEDLLVKFPEDYISYILGVAARKQDSFAYEYLTGDYTYADDYIEQYMKIERMDKQDEPTPENRAALHKELERLKRLPLTHPHGDVLEIYVQMKDTRFQEKDAEQPLPRAEAEAVYEALLSRINANLERYPKDEMTQFIKSEMLYRLERYEEANQTAEEILAENPDYEDAQYCLGDIYYAMDDLTDEQTKRYIHHYNFPPYSVGEARAPRSPGRREIGHGALAERALVPVLPSLEEFPYTIRCVSEVLSSNGSTSQASICGSTLALMDAGVPIKAPVAGISCGLITEGDRWMTMLDIQGVEDFHGDMDFKVGGTRKGITAIQMDIKIDEIGRAHV